MPVKAYITRDPSGNPWPPVHQHEANAVIGLIQRLHEAVHHEPTLYAVFVNLQTPSADLAVLTEMGLGVVELKHYPGRLKVIDDLWYADGRQVKAGASTVGHDTPRQQVQAYANRIRSNLLEYIAEQWAVSLDDVREKLRVQTAVCFTHPRALIEPEVKGEIERDADHDRRRWETFQLLTPQSFAAWASALRFGMEQGRAASFAPYRLKGNQISGLAQRLFRANEWTEIRNLMPTGQPYSYLVLQQVGQEAQLFPLRTTEATLGRDGAQCSLLLPEAYKRVSRAHARITRVAGDVWIEDLDSTHGTFVDGVRVDEMARLTDGQHITLGGPEASDRVCSLLFTHQLASDMRAGATAADPTTGSS